MPEVRESTATGASPEEILRAAFPGRLRRARAVRWLSWIAWRSRDHESFGWWDVPRWLGADALLWPRRVAAAVVIGTGFGLGFGLYNGADNGPSTGFALGLGAGWLAGVLGPPSGSEPFALVPRLPRTVREVRMLTVGVASGVLLRRALIRQWRVGAADGTPDGAYRACLRSALVDATACLTAGLPSTIVAVLAGLPWLLAVAGLVTSFAALGAFSDETLPQLWLAGAARPPHRRRWDRLLRLGSTYRLLTTAERHGLLRPRGVRYEFGSPAIREYLVGREQAIIDANARQALERKRKAEGIRKQRAARRSRYEQAAARASGGVRPWLLRLLSPVACQRLAVDLALGTGAGISAAIVLLPPSPGFWGTVIGVIVIGGLVAFFGRYFVGWLLTTVAESLRWSLWLTGRMSRRVRAGVLAGAVGVAVLVTLGAGWPATRHALAVAGVAVLPGAVVAVVGGWGAALVHQRWHDSAHRLVRHVADAFAAGVTGVALLLWIDHALLGAQAAAALLFPLAVWLSLRAWRLMNSSARLLVRAVADITVSLLLGASLTGLLVCLANMLKMPPAEVSALRDTVDKTGTVLDVPWWVWASGYVVLAGLGVAFLRWPGRLRRVSERFAKLRVVPSAEVLRRGSAGAHIGLLLVALIGSAVPAAVGPVLRVRVADKYTLTLTDIARDQGATAELSRIASELPLLRTPLVPLADLVLDIHKATGQPDGASEASDVELDLARRLGTLQALTLAASKTPPSVEQTEARVTEAAGLDTSAGGAEEEGKRLGKLAEAEHQDDVAKEQAERAGELAATAVAKLVTPLPGLGAGEVAGILREYLSALIEFSPLKDTFAAWAERLGRPTPPPDVADLVVPDPGKLRDAAVAQADQEAARTSVADPAVLKALLAETGIAGAVNQVNQTRFLQENGTGPCDGCARPESGNDNGGGGNHDEPPPAEPVP